MNDQKDAYGTILEDSLINEGGMTMIMNEGTHQNIKQGAQNRIKCIDHIYCNSPERMKNTKAISEAGSHHKITIASLLEKVPMKGPHQHIARVRKSYTKEKLISELDTLNWNTGQTVQATRCHK